MNVSHLSISLPSPPAKPRRHAGLRCTECGYNVHEKCVPQVPKNCAKFGGAGSAIASGASASGGADRHASSGNAPTTTKGAASAAKDVSDAANGSCEKCLHAFV